jgi:hypothetical protein
VRKRHIRRGRCAEVETSTVDDGSGRAG